jgi:hypothetical protein
MAGFATPATQLASTGLVVIDAGAAAAKKSRVISAF